MADVTAEEGVRVDGSGQTCSRIVAFRAMTAVGTYGSTRLVLRIRTVWATRGEPAYASPQADIINLMAREQEGKAWIAS